jgi:hypothetical protein
MSRPASGGIDRKRREIDTETFFFGVQAPAILPFVMALLIQRLPNSGLGGSKP